MIKIIQKKASNIKEIQVKKITKLIIIIIHYYFYIDTKFSYFYTRLKILKKFKQKFNNN